MKSRLIRTRDRVFKVLVGQPDQHSVNLAASMAVATNPVSPMARGGQFWGMVGLPGTGVLENTTLLPYELQHFTGVAGPVAHPVTAMGSLMANSVPSTKAPVELDSTAWLDLGKTPGVRW